MSAFTTNASEYLDICICMLMDAVKKGEEFDTNERWTKFINKGLLLGLKTIIYPIYLTTDVNARIKYKLLSPALRGEDGCYIHIKSSGVKDEEVLPPKKVNKDIVRKIFKKVKQVRMKTSMPITEEKLDKIIDYVEQKHWEEQNG